MQNFSHAWITFAQSLPFLRPVDFLSELLPKAGQLRKHIHVLAVFFFFFLGWGGVGVSGDVLNPEAVVGTSENLNHSSPNTSWCHSTLEWSLSVPDGSSDRPNPPLIVSPRISDPINSTFSARALPKPPSPSLRGTKWISKIDQGVAGIETHLLSSGTEIDFSTSPSVSL